MAATKKRNLFEEIKQGILEIKAYKEEKCERGTTNVYADLGFKNPEEMQAKATLASRIIFIIKKKGWNQQKAAKELGVAESKIAFLCRGQFSSFSLEKLIKLLNKLDQDVDIFVHAKPKNRKATGRLSIALA